MDKVTFTKDLSLFFFRKYLLYLTGMEADMKKRYSICMVAILFMISITGCRIGALSDKQNTTADIKEKTAVVFKTWNPTDFGPDSPIHHIIEDFE